MFLFGKNYIGGCDKSVVARCKQTRACVAKYKRNIKYNIKYKKLKTR